ncbi:MAG: hypothetical protein LC127_07375, partial [Chitinophagales bacterium]|nr:hypothetical protein [Chitinophagales bacterium]
SKEGDLKLIADGNWGETTWKSPDLVLGDQAAITSDGNYVYMLHNGDNHFVRYLPNENRWQTLADAPHYGYYGASLVVLGNYIYAIYGGYQKEFSRYSIIDDTWTERAQLLDLVWHGASLTTDGTYIYALRGSATQDFWRYNPSQNLWETMASPISTMYQGSAIIYYDGNIYALRGYNSNTVYRYNISSNTWYTTTVGGAALASVPATIYTDMTITIRGDQIFVARGYGTKSFYKYDISDNSWTTLTNTPQTNRYVGCIYNSSDDYVYVFRGDGTYDFWKFDPDSGSTGTFLGLTDLPNTPGSGADLIWLDGYLYYLRGNSSQNFYRFNGTSWETLSNTLATFSDDTKGATASGKLYFYRGGNTRTFYSYNPTNGSWTQLADTDSNVYLGAALVYPGSGDYIYGTRGNNTATFWRYSISGNSWNDASVADLPDNAESGYGSRLVSNGNDIFYITGYQRAQFLKYSIANNNWTVLSSLPFAPLWGTDMVYYNGKIYVQAGHYKEQFWEYVVATNTWRRLPDLQTHYANDLGPYNGGSLESDNAGNIYSISGQNILRMDVYTPSSYNYPTSGIWTSAIQDFTYVNSWSSLIANATTPDDSSISYEARSSDDKINWTGWYAVIDGVFPAEVTANRYLQLRVTLNASSDRSQTPILHSLTINYLGDEQVPTNPSNFTGVSQTVGGVNLISGSSYGYTHPYFSWDSGTDSETEVDGYYVYFGTNLAADPETEGSFQTAQNYLVTSPMSIGTYYLRLQTKDAVGNISNAITGFIYSYNGISPTYSLTQTSSVDFSNGILENTSAINDEIKLASKSGFWLEERLSNTPSAMYNGAALAYVSSSNKMYSFRGNSQLTFYEYDLTTNVWATKANAPNSINYGGGVIEGPDGYLFALRGLNTFTFWRYDIVNNEWNDGAAADPPQSASAGTALLYDGSQYIYMLRGNSDDAFLRYDTLADSWESKASVDFGAPITQSNNLVYYGGDLAYDGEDTIYAIQGNTLTGFSSYSITNNTWTPLTNV